MNEIIPGAGWVPLSVAHDERGRLVAFEPGHNLPFPMRRWFVISTDDPDAVRGEHSSAAEELLVVVAGSVTCDLDNGSAQATVIMDPQTDALWLRPGVWIRLRAFTVGTVITVAASRPYRETTQSLNPRPDLIAKALGSAVA
jgi:hypothetical protein